MPASSSQQRRPYRKNAIIVGFVIPVLAYLFVIIFPYPLLRDDAFLPGGVITTIASISFMPHRLLSIYYFSGSGEDVDGNGFFPQSVAFLMVGLKLLVGLSWALKIILLFKAAIGFLFTYLLIRTRFHMDEIGATFGGILFSMNTLLLPSQFASQYIDQFGAGLAVAAVPMIIYAIFHMGQRKKSSRRQFTNVCVMFCMGAAYIWLSHVTLAPVGVVFVIMWYLCEKMFGQDRLLYLAAFVGGASVLLFPLLYSFFLDAFHSARRGIDLFESYSEGGVAALLTQYGYETTAYLFKKKELFLLIMIGAMFCQCNDRLFFRLTMLLLFVVFATGRDLI